ncbi:hypothetical protein ACWDSJ_00640, partial [Nocardia sp. NPDC003482]
MWLKPLKFGLAFALYSATLAWLLTLPHKGSRVTWWLGTVFAVTGLVDVGFIVLQAARGTFSHFNMDDVDGVNRIGQVIFTSGVPGLFVANLVIAVVVSWQRLIDRPTARAIHMGLTIAVFGMALAYLMGGTGSQLVRDVAGRPVELAAGHTVLPHPLPVRDDLPGLPVTHWSTVGGDLRVPHFAGLHGIQVLLLATLTLGYLSRRRPWLTERVRARLIGILGLSYLTAVALLLWQALRAQPLIHPDARTATAFACLALAWIAATGAVVGWARGPRLLRSRGTEKGLHRGAEESARRGTEEGLHRGAEESARRGTEEGLHRGAEESARRGTEEG